MRRIQIIQGSLMILTLLLGACGYHGAHKPMIFGKKTHQKEREDDGPPDLDIDVTHIPNAIPKLEPLSAYGNQPVYNVFGINYRTLPHSKGYAAEGTASWYGRKFHGQRTSSGEVYDMFGMTAAHRSLPLPTYAKVKNLLNGNEVIVKINDRGPFVKDRLIDLSYAAAKKLGIHATGTGKVLITAIDPKAWHQQKAKLTELAQADKRQTAKSEKAAKATTIAKADKSANKLIYLQLGSFTQKTNAEQLASKATILAKAFQPANVHVLSSKKANKDSYKVRIGPLKDEAQATALQKKLLALNAQSPAKLIYE